MKSLTLLIEKIQSEFTFEQPDSGIFVNNLYTTIPNTSVNTTFTTYGTTTGTYKIGTFVGTFTDNSSVPHTLNGTFRLKNP